METEEEKIIMEIQHMSILDEKKYLARWMGLCTTTDTHKKAIKFVAILNSNLAYAGFMDKGCDRVSACSL